VDAKYDNQQIAERAFYTNSIIPDSESEDEQWTAFLGIDKLGLSIQTDFSHLPSLQEDQAERGRGMWYMNQGAQIAFLMNQLTWNEWRDMMGMDKSKEATGDLYYYQLIAEPYKWVFGPVPNTAAPGSEVPPTNNTQNNNNGTAN
jgi:hypothetical protein